MGDPRHSHQDPPANDVLAPGVEPHADPAAEATGAETICGRPDETPAAPTLAALLTPLRAAGERVASAVRAHPGRAFLLSALLGWIVGRASRRRARDSS